MEFTTTDLIGYLASFAVLISFLMKDLRKLRIINSLGCAFFVCYGILLDYSMPIIITNTAILGINAYHIFKVRQ
jgi:hypothetical protein